MATNFFEDFPKIAYSLDNGETEQVVVDIFKRVILSKEYRENSLFYEKYEIAHGETPEEVSFKFYGTPSLHWLILMVNDIIDPRFEWPISEEVLIRQVDAKYGGEKNIFSSNRAKDAKGFQVETFFVLTEESTHKEPSRLLFEFVDEDTPNTPIPFAISETIADFESNYEVEQEKNESYRNIIVLKPEIVQDILTNYKVLINQ